jgi:hypothetical protein
VWGGGERNRERIRRRNRAQHGAHAARHATCAQAQAQCGKRVCAMRTNSATRNRGEQRNRRREAGTAQRAQQNARALRRCRSVRYEAARTAQRATLPLRTAKTRTSRQPACRPAPRRIGNNQPRSTTTTRTLNRPATNKT